MYILSVSFKIQMSGILVTLPEIKLLPNYLNENFCISSQKMKLIVTIPVMQYRDFFLFSHISIVSYLVSINLILICLVLYVYFQIYINS